MKRQHNLLYAILIFALCFTNAFIFYWAMFLYGPVATAPDNLVFCQPSDFLPNLTFSIVESSVVNLLTIAIYVLLWIILRGFFERF